MLFLEAFLGLSQNEWVLIGVVAAALILILITVLIIVKSRKGKKAKKAQAESVEEVNAEEAVALPVNEEEEDGANEDCSQPVAESASTNKTENSVQATAEQNEVEKVDEKAKVSNKVYHISKRKSDNRWQVKMSKGAKAIKLFFTQAEAIEYAKKLAVNQEARIIIHKEDGSFRKLTYKSKK